MTYLTDRQVADRYQIARQTVWLWARKGLLPKPVAITSGCTRWRLEDIERHDEKRAADAA